MIRELLELPDGGPYTPAIVFVVYLLLIIFLFVAIVFSFKMIELGASLRILRLSKEWAKLGGFREGALKKTIEEIKETTGEAATAARKATVVAVEATREVKAEIQAIPPRVVEEIRQSAVGLSGDDLSKGK